MSKRREKQGLAQKLPKELETLLQISESSYRLQHNRGRQIQQERHNKAKSVDKKTVVVNIQWIITQINVDVLGI